MNETAAAIKEKVQSRSAELIGLSRRIWENPETAFREEFASSLTADYLHNAGFAIEKNTAGLSTAFTARWGGGKPVIGFLGEYDALPGLSQTAGVARRREMVPGGAGHGCGHNLLGVGSAGAAVALKEYMEQNGLPGTVCFFGCPAEENGCGKEHMVRAGAFADTDVCFTWHPDSRNCVVAAPYLANIIFTVSFRGKPAHAAAAPELGRSALDACELMNVGANYLREHVTDDVRFHYAYIDSGGASPNTVQEKAALRYYVRARHIDDARRITERLHKIAQGAALMTETRLTFRIENEMYDYRPNDVLSRLMDEAFRKIGGPDYSLQEQETAALFADGSAAALNGTIEPYVPTEKCLFVSSDVGNVSQTVPTAQCYVCCYARGTMFHTWQLTAQAALPAAFRGMLTAASVLALAGAQVVKDPSLTEKARQELQNL